MKKPYTVKEIKPRIFLLSFKDHYDLCMHFVRYQEFYESPFHLVLEENNSNF